MQKISTEPTQSKPQLLTKNDLLGAAYDLQALAKAIAYWLCNHVDGTEYGDLDPSQGDMVALAGLLVNQCAELVAELDNPALVVEVRS